jgi:hypothetical protein
MNYSGNFADFATLVRPTTCGPKPLGRISRYGEVNYSRNPNSCWSQGNQKKAL